MDWPKIFLGVLNALLVRLGSQELCWAPDVKGGPSVILLEPTRASYFIAPTATSTVASSAAAEMPFGLRLFLKFFSGNSVWLLIPLVLGFFALWIRVHAAIAPPRPHRPTPDPNDARADTTNAEAASDDVEYESFRDRQLESVMRRFEHEVFARDTMTMVCLTFAFCVMVTCSQPSATAHQQSSYFPASPQHLLASGTEAKGKQRPDYCDKAVQAGSPPPFLDFSPQEAVADEEPIEPDSPEPKPASTDTSTLTDELPALPTRSVDLTILMAILSIIKIGFNNLRQAGKGAMSSTGNFLDKKWDPARAGELSTVEIHKQRLAASLVPHLGTIDAGLAQLLRELACSILDAPRYEYLYLKGFAGSKTAVSQENTRLTVILKYFYQARWKGERAEQAFFRSQQWAEHIAIEQQTKWNAQKSREETDAKNKTLERELTKLEKEIERRDKEDAAVQMMFAPAPGATGDETMSTRERAPTEVEGIHPEAEVKVVCKLPPAPPKKHNTDGQPGMPNPQAAAFVPGAAPTAPTAAQAPPANEAPAKETLMQSRWAH